MLDNLFLLQFKTIAGQNLLLAFRSRELVTDVVVPLVLALLIIFQKYLDIIKFLSPALFSMAIAGSARSLLIHMVEQKSERQKETQKIMGLRQSSYILAWLASSYARGIVSFLCFMVPISVSNVDGLENVGQLFLAYFLYTFAVTHFALVISCYFSSPKLAGELGTLFLVITGLASFLQLYDQFSESSFNFYLMGMFPTSAMAFGYITSYNQIPYGPIQQYTINQCIVQLAIELVVYIILYFYLDQILPNQYGVQKHPCFFLMPNSRRKANRNKLEEELVEENDEDYNMEDISSAIYHQKFENKGGLATSVIIRDLRKIFGNFTAVDGISLNLYEKNIFCLLGHNGAGQTTTISVLTGMLSQSAGRVRVYGKNLDNQLDEIRKSVGLCTQRDVLYDNLSFEETLRFYGQIKGLSGAKLDAEVEYIFKKTGANSDRIKLVKELSGGNQRKLSLGCALIGGSQLVFLDEPTSGMDAISRKKLWNILESVRNENRTIVLTTHHLDEAEALADRIAIMSRGKLLALGTNQFIKKNFGIGYQLRITPNLNVQNAAQNFKNSKNMIQEVVSRQIEQATLNPQSAEDTIIFMIPFKAQKKFVGLFEQLNDYDFLAINLQMNSLEDAFVNIGMDEENFIEQSVKSNAQGVNTRTSVKVKEILNDKKKEEKKTNNDQFTDFQNIVVPACLSLPPKYSFMSQFTAIFYRRYYCTVRNYVNWFAFFMMLLIVVLGTIVVNFITFDGIVESAVPSLKLSFLASFLTMAFCFSSAAFILLPVMQREYNLKYALNVMGCRVVPYWAGTLAFDYIIYTILITIFIILSYVFQFQFVTGYIFQIVVILLCFGFAYITFSYMFGFLFNKSNVALKAFPIFNFIVTWSVPWTVLGILNVFRNNNNFSEDTYIFLNDAAQVLCLILSPFWTINMGMSVIKFVEISVNVDDQDFKSMKVLTSDWYVYALVLVANGVLYCLYTYYLEQKTFDLSAQQAKVAAPNGTSQPLLNNLNNSGSNDAVQIGGDELVMAERKRIFDNHNSDKIRVVDLQKTYDNGFTAIHNNTFASTQGEIFGLLGPNGAGKSTTFNILTSLIPKTSGSVMIKGIEVNKGIMEIYQDVGICPQFDCLWEHLTPPEHLLLFGRMKGLKGRDLQEAVRYFLEIMQLTDYVNRKAGRLSGGNKRKLCVTNALIGGPDIQFFDEPSTGVDPIARRFLWNTLSQGLKLRNSAICMTTHTMEEAESLCTQIGILINGQFYTIGTPQQLRDKYGTGYTLTIQSGDDRFIGILQKTFPNIRRLPNKQEGYFTFQISREEFNFYKAFSTCEIELKEKNLIEDFSIRQSSLEQVFLFFSKYQISQDGEENADISLSYDQASPKRED